MLVFVLVLVADLQVVDAIDCIDRSELSRDLEALVPSDTLAGLSVRVEVARDENEVRVELAIREGTSSLLERDLRITETDCPDAPRAIARILARQLEGLERPEAPPPPPPPVVEPTPGWRSAPYLAAGGLVGLAPVVPGLRLALGVELSQPEVPALVVGVLADLNPPVDVGSGTAHLLRAAATAGVGFDVEWDSIRFTPQVLLAAGLVHAWGVDFDEAESVLLPSVSVDAGMVLRTTLGFLARVGLELPLTRVRLRERGNDTHVFEGPVVQLALTLGYEWRFQ